MCTASTTTTTRRRTNPILLLVLLSLIFLVSPCLGSQNKEGATLVQEAFSLEKNHGNATQLWLKAAALGNETAQYMVGVMHAWGLNGQERDESKAVLYFYFSSLGGYVPAQMALGYRHLTGNGTPVNCKCAALYLELAANSAIDELGSIGNVELGFSAERIIPPDEAKLETRAYADIDVVDYYHNLANKGDFAATGTLGRIYYYGAKGVERDLVQAHNFLLLSALKSDYSSMTSLGHILLQGVPGKIEPDPSMAWSNFTVAANGGFGPAHNGLGYMRLHGYPGVIDQDVGEALKHFSKAADSAVPEAFYNLGALYSSSQRPQSRDFTKSYRYFGLAAQKGNVLALHKVAHMTLHGIGTIRSCKQATQYFKSVAERAYFATKAHEGFSEAYAGFKSAPLEMSLELYLRLAEMGYEVAESNAARVYDEIHSKIYSTENRNTLLGGLHGVLDTLGLSHPPLNGSQHALKLYERAAEQGNHKARVRVGDYFFYGFDGVDEPDFVEAAAHYRLASDGRDPQAHFNLGYQHHYGIGLSKDSHLAKRYYDLASETSSDAKFAVQFAMAFLWFENTQKAFSSGDKFSTDDVAVSQWIDWWTGGDNNDDHNNNEVREESTTTTNTNGWGSSFSFTTSDLLSLEIATDTILIGLFLAIFVFIGWFRDYRVQQERRRERMQ